LLKIDLRINWTGIYLYLSKYVWNSSSNVRETHTCISKEEKRYVKTPLDQSTNHLCNSYQHSRIRKHLWSNPTMQKWMTALAAPYF
jgi:hypothetical protein